MYRTNEIQKLALTRDVHECPVYGESHTTSMSMISEHFVRLTGRLWPVAG
jgi:hypothetical protein